MPLTIPSGLLTKANFITTYLKPLLDSTETAAANAQTTANSANTLAGQKYTKPAGGIPVSDLAGTAVNIVVLRPVAGAWPVRPTSSTNVTYIWLRAALTDPVVPIGGTGAVVGIDLVLQPDA